ncbi:MAG: hypothetical protein HZA64_11820 [Rhodocyclales bacterium]|nr:hypothetical protein [Rhodocyclales bacterium]
MSDSKDNQNPMEFFKSLWSSMGVPLPGMVTPTVDTDELGRRISDLKAVEGWMKSNLSMLQMTIQGLEMQRATLLAIQAISQPASESQPSPEAYPFANPALWSWGFMQPTAPEDTAPAAAQGVEPQEPSAPKRKPKR